jgi:tRNA pseudouridine55 synthase
VSLRVHCSAGFYVRSLAHDLGLRLGVGAHLAALRRTRSGEFTVGQAMALEAIERDPSRAAAALVPLPAVLPALPVLRLSPDGVNRAKHGCELGQNDSVTGQPLVEGPNALYRLFDSAGDLVGIARARSSPGVLHPVVVLM